MILAYTKQPLVTKNTKEQTTLKLTEDMLPEDIDVEELVYAAYTQVELDARKKNKNRVKKRVKR
jgi:hypothetical protein